MRLVTRMRKKKKIKSWYIWYFTPYFIYLFLYQTKIRSHFLFQHASQYFSIQLNYEEEIPYINCDFHSSFVLRYIAGFQVSPFSVICILISFLMGRSRCTIYESSLSGVVLNRRNYEEFKKWHSTSRTRLSVSGAQVESREGDSLWLNVKRI